MNIKSVVIVYLLLFSTSMFIFISTDFGRSLYTKVFPAKSFTLELRGCFAQGSFSSIVNCADQNVDLWVKNLGPSTVSQELEKYEGFGSICHSVGHEIGGAIFNYHDQQLAESMTSCSNACFNSCLHGTVIEFGFQEGEQSLIALNAGDVCQGASTTRGEYELCIHGFGHAYMLGADYNTAVALRACGNGLGSEANSTTLGSCYSGVFMELFVTANRDGHDTIPEKYYRKEGDSFYPCTREGIVHTPYEGACYIQLVGPLWRQAWREGNTIFNVCEEAPYELAREYCFAGIGLMQASRDPSISDAVETCQKIADNDDRNRCLHGALSYLAFQTDKEILQQEFCGTLEDSQDNKNCEQFLASYLLIE
jgi:hypothetical protein